MGGVCLKNEKLGRLGSELAQIAKIELSDGSGGKTIPMTVKIGYCRSRFEGYLGNVGLVIVVVALAANRLAILLIHITMRALCLECPGWR